MPLACIMWKNGRQIRIHTDLYMSSRVSFVFLSKTSIAASKVGAVCLHNAWATQYSKTTTRTHTEWILASQQTESEHTTNNSDTKLRCRPHCLLVLCILHNVCATLHINVLDRGFFIEQTSCRRLYRFVASLHHRLHHLSLALGHAFGRHAHTL